MDNSNNNPIAPVQPSTNPDPLATSNMNPSSGTWPNPVTTNPLPDLNPKPNTSFPPSEPMQTWPPAPQASPAVYETTAPAAPWSNPITTSPAPNPTIQPTASFPPSEPMQTWPPAPQASPTLSDSPSSPTPWSTPTAMPVQSEPAQLSSVPASTFSETTPQQFPQAPIGSIAQDTLSQPQSIPSPLSTQNTTSIPLDNPYGAPIQPPPSDNGLQNQQSSFGSIPAPVQPEPAWSPSQTPPEPSQTTIEQTNILPSSQNTAQAPQTSSEQAPTDLSHLIGNSESPQSPIAQPETVIVPQMNAPEVPNTLAENEQIIPGKKAGIPKWVIGLGVGLLIVVSGASAYFILGIGQTPKNTSLPAVEAPKVTQQSTPAPVVTPQPAQETATGSANFGALQGSGTAPQATASAAPNGSFDRLKAR